MFIGVVSGVAIKFFWLPFGLTSLLFYDTNDLLLLGTIDLLSRGLVKGETLGDTTLAALLFTIVLGEPRSPDSFAEAYLGDEDPIVDPKACFC